MRIWAEKPVMIPDGVRSPTMLTVNLLPSGTLVGTSSRMAVTVPWLAAWTGSGPDWLNEKTITIVKTAMSRSASAGSSPHFKRARIVVTFGVVIMI